MLIVYRIFFCVLDYVLLLIYKQWIFKKVNNDNFKLENIGYEQKDNPV